MALSRSLTVALVALVVCVCVIGVRPVRATRVDDIGRTTLVVLDDLAQRATYSRFFSSLTGARLARHGSAMPQIAHTCWWLFR